jgi:hypothetical protein
MREQLSQASAKPAFQSLTIQSLAAIAVAAVANRFGVLLPDGFAHDAIATAVDFVTSIGVLGAAIGRARARAPLG